MVSQCAADGQMRAAERKRRKNKKKRNLSNFFYSVIWNVNFLRELCNGLQDLEKKSQLVYEKKKFVSLPLELTHRGDRRQEMAQEERETARPRSKLKQESNLNRDEWTKWSGEENSTLDTAFYFMLIIVHEKFTLRYSRVSAGAHTGNQLEWLMKRAFVSCYRDNRKSEWCSPDAVHRPPTYTVSGQGQRGREDRRSLKMLKFIEWKWAREPLKWKVLWSPRQCDILTHLSLVTVIVRIKLYDVISHTIKRK